MSFRDLIPEVGEMEHLALTDTLQIRIALKKTDHNDIMLDVRKWIKWTGTEKHVPSNKGICLDVEGWTAVMPVLQAKVKELESVVNANLEKIRIEK